MELKGEYSLSATRDDVWAALGDPDVLAKCIPGCESVEKISDNEMKAVVSVQVGPFKSRFTGTIRLSDGDRPAKGILQGEGRGHPSGTAKGTASVELTEADGGTLVSFVGEAEVGGKLADVLDHIVEDFARAMTGTFFSRLSKELEPSSEEWVDQLDHSPAGVVLGDEPSEDVVVDKAESAAKLAERVEEEVEIAAEEGLLGGPYVWGLLAVIVLIIILVVIY